jgi:membrane protein
MRALAPLARRCAAIKPVRIVVQTFKMFHDTRAGHMASSLSFQTLVSTVPVLLFMVGILKRFLPGDPGRDLHAFMSTYLVPEVAMHVTDTLMDLIEGFNFAALGWIGAVGTFLATYMLILNLKSCLNDLGFKSSRSGFFKRLGWVTLVVVLVPPLGWLIASESRFLVDLPSFMTMLRPYLSTAAVIFLAYRFLPDRGPSSASSMLSAALVALLLEMEKVGLAYYIKQFKGIYEVVYGTLMFIPLMLAWLYLSWCLLLLGAALAASIDDVLGRRKPTILPPGPAA